MPIWCCNGLLLTICSTASHRSESATERIGVQGPRQQRHAQNHAAAIGASIDRDQSLAMSFVGIPNPNVEPPCLCNMQSPSAQSSWRSSSTFPVSNARSLRLMEQVTAHKSVRQECPTRVSVIQAVPQECMSVPQRFPKRMCPTRVSHKSVSYKSCNNCLGVRFRVRVCIRVRGFHLVFVSGREGANMIWTLQWNTQPTTRGSPLNC